jgi:hypothetical protein
MTEHHSTAPSASGKPAKPPADYPLTAHPAGHWGFDTQFDFSGWSRTGSRTNLPDLGVK